ncbi:MAG TPA: hypothetical protein VD997_05795 [Phycisphaerales bacterium]|nr:hypothetical protein [Phycisphaerales bacterium]
MAPELELEQHIAELLERPLQGPGATPVPQKTPAGLAQYIDEICRLCPDPEPGMAAESERLLASTTTIRDLLSRTSRVIARLLTPPGAPVLQGFRGRASLEHRAYTSASAEIDVKVVPAGDGFTIRGQVDPAGTNPVVAIVLTAKADGTVLEVIEPGPGGIFSLDCQPGTYDLMALVGAEWVVAPDIHVG